MLISEDLTGVLPQGIIWTSYTQPGGAVWPAQPEIFWYFNMTENGGGQAAGRFTILNSPSGNPCLVAFTDDNNNGLFFLSASDEPQGGWVRPVR